jgi:hypothetical protein
MPFKSPDILRYEDFHIGGQFTPPFSSFLINCGEETGGASTRKPKRFLIAQWRAAVRSILIFLSRLAVVFGRSPAGPISVLREIAAVYVSLGIIEYYHRTADPVDRPCVRNA